MKKSDTVVVAFRIDRTLLKEVDKAAVLVRRSRPNYILVALESAVAKAELPSTTAEKGA